MAVILTLLRAYYRQDFHSDVVPLPSQVEFCPRQAPAYHFLLGSLWYRSLI